MNSAKHRTQLLLIYFNTLLNQAEVLLAFRLPVEPFGLPTLPFPLLPADLLVDLDEARVPFLVEPDLLIPLEPPVLALVVPDLLVELFVLPLVEPLARVEVLLLEVDDLRVVELAAFRPLVAAVLFFVELAGAFRVEAAEVLRVLAVDDLVPVPFEPVDDFLVEEDFALDEEPDFVVVDRVDVFGPLDDFLAVGLRPELFWAEEDLVFLPLVAPLLVDLARLPVDLRVDAFAEDFFFAVVFLDFVAELLLRGDFDSLPPSEDSELLLSSSFRSGKSSREVEAKSSSCSSDIPVCVSSPARFLANSAPINFCCAFDFAGITLSSVI